MYYYLKNFKSQISTLVSDFFMHAYIRDTKDVKMFKSKQHLLRMWIFWPVSLIVVLIFIHADQLVGTGLVSQKAQVFQGWRHFHQMLQQGLNVGEVSQGRGQGIWAVNYISIYSALPPGLASKRTSNLLKPSRKELNRHCAWEYKEWVNLRARFWHLLWVWLLSSLVPLPISWVAWCRTLKTLTKWWMPCGKNS